MDPFEQLGLSSEASTEEVKDAWRRLASIHHPDKGGDAATFDRLRQAYNAALTEAEAQKPCPSCQGTGRVLVKSGWSSVKLLCEACGGTGEKS